MYFTGRRWTPWAHLLIPGFLKGFAHIYTRLVPSLSATQRPLSQRASPPSALGVPTAASMGVEVEQKLAVVSDVIHRLEA